MANFWFEPRSSLLALTLCVACGGSSFGSASSGGAGSSSAQAGSSQTSGGHTGSAGASSAGQTSAAGAANGGQTGAAGTANGGQTGSAGAANGGQTGSAGAANGGHAGDVAGGGTIGSGGSSAGATASAGSPAGGSGGTDCAALKVEYDAAVQKARICTQGGMGECSSSSTLPAVSCGCPVLVNAKSANLALAKQKLQALQDGKCNAGPICNIACLAYASAACMPSATAAPELVCTGSFGAVN